MSGFHTLEGMRDARRASSLPLLIVHIAMIVAVAWTVTISAPLYM